MLQPAHRLVRAVAPLALAAIVAACATGSAGYRADREYVASFNEPFINITTDGDYVAFRSPERTEGISFAADRVDLREGSTFTFQREDDQPRSTLRLSITRTACQDDMSGLTFSHSATLHRMSDGNTLFGCARLASEPPPAE